MVGRWESVVLEEQAPPARWGRKWLQPGDYLSRDSSKTRGRNMLVAGWRTRSGTNRGQRAIELHVKLVIEQGRSGTRGSDSVSLNRPRRSYSNSEMEETQDTGTWAHRCVQLAECERGRMVTDLREKCYRATASPTIYFTD